MKNVIACRPQCYDLPLPEAMSLLKEIGIDNVELGVAADTDYDNLRSMVSGAGMKISSLAFSGMKLDDPENIARVERGIEGARRVGTRVLFLSASLKNGTYEDGIPTLKEVAQKASAAGVVFSIETHAPFGQNGEVARKTIETVNSPGIGYNFDPANIYYYNPKGIDAVEELKEALPYVTSVHLKDSAKGESGESNFPVLGEGVVNFPEIFRLLEERSFIGPYTLELEGPVVAGLPVEERTGKVKACVKYLKNIGAMG